MQTNVSMNFGAISSTLFFEYVGVDHLYKVQMTSHYCEVLEPNKPGTAREKKKSFHKPLFPLVSLSSRSKSVYVLTFCSLRCINKLQFVYDCSPVGVI
jgi:hypothetical protein